MSIECFGECPVLLLPASAFWLDASVNPWSSVGFAAFIAEVASDKLSFLLRSAVLSEGPYRALWKIALNDAKLGLCRRCSKAPTSLDSPWSDECPHTHHVFSLHGTRFEYAPIGCS